MLGGTSNLNAMIYIRGSRHDYDNWVKDGSEGWSYEDVLPYFLKSEDAQEPLLQNSSKGKTAYEFDCSTFTCTHIVPHFLTVL